MKKELKLNIVISILVVMVVFFATLINLYSATNALKTSLTNNYLVSNHNYTTKLAEAVDYITSELQKNIIAIANLSSSIDFQKQSNLDILFNSEKEHFNSIFITDTNGVIQLISPSVINSPDGKTVKAGTKIDTEIMKRALTEKKPFISEPYKTVSGTLLFLVTAPIFDEKGEHKGVMVGTVYLENQNAIKMALGTHGYNDGSYVFAVDKNGHILYHPNSSKVYENISDNPIVKKLKQGKSGFEKVTIADQEYFAGYTQTKNLGWGVVSLTPASTINEPINNLLIKIVTRSLTTLIVLLIIATLLVRNLTRPLTELALYSEKAILNNEIDKGKDVINIRSHIYEINQLYRQVKSHIVILKKEVQLDGLTGLANRRTFDATIKEWTLQKHSFSLVFLDIDNFKKVNDTYGHLVGDDVIKYLANIINNYTGEDDLSFRYGGEEFGILIKDKNEEDAYNIAEQLRLKIEQTKSPTGKPITVSLGVTSIEDGDIHPKTIIERADQALYQSKKDGKNKTTIYKE
ncbi:diguanylate cyclase (GGDEF)-like protein [Ureibacillus xyleni]|uniref:Diguanylate cyclase (GGDEF)-like protein n=1 Tax=Ureibacillus xyleni TaxID=614648 RepID=A0A285S2K5_9BACL|nr:sensor domain-containing diguanylate cyclase [Ureibacillus xyleni]SOB99304.1 diguanylate cyclase (GGDEF)-like protein [Ureibacillus xyleni]